MDVSWLIMLKCRIRYYSVRKAQKRDYHTPSSPQEASLMMSKLLSLFTAKEPPTGLRADDLTIYGIRIYLFGKSTIRTNFTLTRVAEKL